MLIQWVGLVLVHMIARENAVVQVIVASNRLKSQYIGLNYAG